MCTSPSCIDTYALIDSTAHFSYTKIITPADVTFHVFSNMDHRSDGNMDHKKQAQMTFNLFHFSRHRVPYIQDGEKGGMGSRVV